jgi:hypothetical protein
MKNVTSAHAAEPPTTFPLVRASALARFDFILEHNGIGEARGQFRPTIAPIAPFLSPLWSTGNAWQMSDGRSQAASALGGPSEEFITPLRAMQIFGRPQSCIVIDGALPGEEWKASVMRQIATLGSEPTRRLCGRECPFPLFRLLEANGQPTTKFSRPECGCEGPLRVQAV